MSDLDETHNIFHLVTKKYVYITIDNVPTGVKFYTKPGSGQCRYQEQGTPDTYPSLWIVLCSCMFYFECSTPNNRNSQPGFYAPFRYVQLCMQILSQVGHLEQNMQLYGVGHSVLSAVFCIAWLVLTFPCSSWFALS